MRHPTQVLLAGLVASVVAFALPVGAGQKLSRDSKGALAEIMVGTIVAKEHVKLESAAGGAAVMGGLVGLNHAHKNKHSGQSELEGAVAGAVIAAGLTKAMEGSNKAVQFTIETNEGRMFKIVLEKGHGMTVGDCVSLENGKHANLHRVAAEMCDSRTSREEHDQFREGHRDEVDACEQAKDMVLSAKSERDTETAIRKMKIVCEH